MIFLEINERAPLLVLRLLLLFLNQPILRSVGKLLAREENMAAILRALRVEYER